MQSYTYGSPEYEMWKWISNVVLVILVLALGYVCFWRKP